MYPALYYSGLILFRSLGYRLVHEYLNRPPNLYFFNLLFIVALNARSYRDCHWFSVWKWYFDWYFEPQQSHMRFFLIQGRHLSGRVQSSHRANSATWTTMTSDNPICRAESNVVTGPHPTRSIMRSGDPIYELLYEFRLHCHNYVGELTSNHWKFTIFPTMVSDQEKQ